MQHYMSILRTVRSGLSIPSEVFIAKCANMNRSENLRYILRMPLYGHVHLVVL